MASTAPGSDTTDTTALLIRENPFRRPVGSAEALPTHPISILIGEIDQLRTNAPTPARIEALLQKIYDEAYRGDSGPEWPAMNKNQKITFIKTLQEDLKHLSLDPESRIFLFAVATANHRDADSTLKGVYTTIDIAGITAKSLKYNNVLVGTEAAFAILGVVGLGLGVAEQIWNFGLVPDGNDAAQGVADFAPAVAAGVAMSARAVRVIPTLRLQKQITDAINTTYDPADSAPQPYNRYGRYKGVLAFTAVAAIGAFIGMAFSNNAAGSASPSQSSVLEDVSAGLFALGLCFIAVAIPTLVIVCCASRGIYRDRSTRAAPSEKEIAAAARKFELEMAPISSPTHTDASGTSAAHSVASITGLHATAGAVRTAMAAPEGGAPAPAPAPAPGGTGGT